MSIKKYKEKFIIVMYHCIVKNRDYFNGLNEVKFEQQIKYFKKNYNILNPNEFYKKLKEDSFSKKDCLLTFDDGYQSHFKYAYKILTKYKLKGFFFPIMLGYNSNKIHHINKIQLLLKLRKDKKKLFEEIKNLIKNENKKIYKKFDLLISKIERNKTYDSNTDLIIKRLLQRDLPILLREKICNNLFKKIKIKKEILKKFYMNDSQLIKLKKEGHEIGVHTKSHHWMSMLSETQQKKEIKNSLNYLKKKKIIDKRWTFCYPYGDYNVITKKVLKKLNCSAAFTTGNKPAMTKNIKKYDLCRLDCNEFL